MGSLWFLRHVGTTFSANSSWFGIGSRMKWSKWLRWVYIGHNGCIAVCVKTGSGCSTLTSEVCPGSEQIFRMGNFNCNLWTSTENLDIFWNHICFLTCWSLLAFRTKTHTPGCCVEKAPKLKTRYHCHLKYLNQLTKVQQMQKSDTPDVCDVNIVPDTTDAPNSWRGQLKSWK